MYRCKLCGFSDLYLGMNHHFRKSRCLKLPKNFDPKADWNEYAETVADSVANRDEFIEIKPLKIRKDE
jgi:hypothetical protein